MAQKNADKTPLKPTVDFKYNNAKLVEKFQEFQTPDPVGPKNEALHQFDESQSRK